MLQMEGPSAYYNQSMQYAHDAYNISSAGYQVNQRNACVYARNTANDGFGGQSMSVVEQGLQGLNNATGQLTHNHGLQQGMPIGAAGSNHMSNTTPAHMQNVPSSHHQMSQLQMAQPPPAHQPQNTQPLSPEVEGATMHGGQKNQQSNLQFPWMKTTKSHAAQWKAQWPGTWCFFFRRVFSC